MIKIDSTQNPNLSVSGKSIETIVIGADGSALLAALKAEQYAAEALASKEAAAASEANAKASETNAANSKSAAATSATNAADSAAAADGSILGL